MSTGFFGDIAPVQYEGPDSENEFAYRHYNPGEMIMGKSMEDHLRSGLLAQLLLAWRRSVWRTDF